MDRVVTERPPGERPVPPRKARRRGNVALIALLVGGGFVVNTAMEELRRRADDPAGLSIADYQARARVVDRAAPEFRAPRLDGAGRLGLGDFPGNVVVVNFWASWCGPCRRETPGLIRTAEAYEGRDVRFLGINFRDNDAAARAYEEEFAVTFPSVVDADGLLAHKFAVPYLPTTLIVSADRRIVYEYTGVVTEALLWRSLDDVLGAGT